MANMNIGTPRFYPDHISYLLSRGTAQNGNFDVETGSNLIGIQNGSEPELFDMNPLNKVDFNTSAATSDHVLININTAGAFKKSFVAILNHNMDSADAKVRIKASDTESHVQAVDMGSATAMSNPAEVVNADAISSSIVTPASDGSTIVRFDESTLRYWGIQFEGDGSGTFDGSTDLHIGCILIGEIYEMPHAPDVSITRSVAYDGVEVLESAGGQRFANMSNPGKQVSSTTLSPFATSIYTTSIHGGRITYDMNFSFIDSTDLMPDEMHSISTSDDAVVEDVWNKTNGPHIPFIFSIDKDSEGADAESEHIFARFTHNSLQMNQVAPNLFNVKMKIEEEF